MGTTYERANKAIEAMVQHALEKYHHDLHKEGVTVDCTIVRKVADEMDVHAMKRSGYPIDAKVGVTSLQDRARGIADAKLMVDGYEWNKATDRQRLALIDHELEHLDLAPVKPTKKEPNLTGNKRDDLGRPVLKVRPHDWQLAGFKTVAERHGEHSHEAMQFRAFRTEYAQLNFFGPPDVLAIANGNGKPTKPAKSSSKSFHEKVGDMLHEKGVKFEEHVSIKEPDLSRACAGRHHKNCKYSGCQCDCHGQHVSA